jgi:hypothetical protein
MRLEPDRLVFIDETGTTTKMTRLRGRGLKGHRLRSKPPFGHWKTQTFVAGLRSDGLTAPFVVDQPMNRRIFEVYVETQLAPTLKHGDRDAFLQAITLLAEQRGRDGAYGWNVFNDASNSGRFSASAPAPLELYNLSARSAHEPAPLCDA